MVSYADPERSEQPRRRPDPRAIAERRAAARERNASLSPEAAYAAAREDALRMLDQRARSRGEVVARLAERGYRDDVTQAVADRLGEVGLIDDAALAYALARDAHSGRGLVGRALAERLRRRKLPDDLVAEAVAEVVEDPRARARALAAKKMRTCVAVGRERAVARTASYLARRGYGAGVCYEAAATAWEEAQE